MRPPRLAWFSPMPPVRSGIATNSAELVAALGADYTIDVFTHVPAPGAHSAHDFVWRHRQQPYDLTVHQLGNSSHHNFIWPYLFRFPGLAVLHDAHLHHARAALLLTEQRGGEYRAEFAANHPGASPDLAELAAAGFDSYLYYLWPMTRLVVLGSRAAAVHSRGMAERLREELPDAAVETIRLTQGEPIAAEREARARAAVRERFGMAADALVIGAFGGLTPEKRIPQILDAFAATAASAPNARLLLAGAPAGHYDAAADARARGLAERVTIAGYLESDADLTDAIAASDVVVNLRWPTAREVSGPWLRALAAGKPTVTIDLAHLWDVPSLDPRTWTVSHAGVRDPGSGIRSSDDRRQPGHRVPDAGVRDPGSGIRSSDDWRQPGHRTPDAGIRDPGSGIRSSDDRRQPGHRIPDPGPRTPDPGPRTPDPGPRTPDPGPRTPAPVTVAIDILDEDHSLRLALRRLTTDPALRASLGAAAQRYWREQHSPEASVADYHRAIARALDRPAPRLPLPAHLTGTGDRALRQLLAPFGLTPPWRDGVHFDDSSQR